MIRKYAKLSAKIVVAWGRNGHLEGRDKEVLKVLKQLGKKVYCLGKTKDKKFPKHPLAVSSHTDFNPFN